jgi:ATP-dependent exoDNAse (exonuclease V) beta subunit
LLRHLTALVDGAGWNATRADGQALLAAADAVTVSTWHRAKGLEWPVTVLFGLETLRDPQAHGLHVMSDRAAFDVRDPLGGRWLRFWPNPYTNAIQHGPVKTAFEASDAYATLRARGDREALRVLYVGWTRARDRLVLAAQRGQLLGGLLGKLRDLEPGLIDEPVVEGEAQAIVAWGGRSLRIDVRPAAPAAPVETQPVAGEIIEGRVRTVFPPARMSPSAAVAVACELGAPVTLGPRLALRGTPPMNLVGDAVHAFLAADRPGLEADARRAMAAGLLARFGVAANLDADELLAAASRFWTWIDAAFPGARLHREWPVAERLANGTLAAGTADLVVKWTGGASIIDHKTFPGVDTLALDRARACAGQLACYASAVAAATGGPVESTWIHFPVIGQVVQVVI